MGTGSSISPCISAEQHAKAIHLLPQHKNHIISLALWGFEAAGFVKNPVQAASGSGAGWQRAWFGTMRPQVQVLSPRPFKPQHKGSLKSGQKSKQGQISGFAANLLPIEKTAREGLVPRLFLRGSLLLGPLSLLKAATCRFGVP